MPAAGGGHDTYEEFFGDSHIHDHEAEEPEQITAFLLGLKSRGAALGLQRAINTYKGEPLTAAMPGVTLQELWDAIGVAENALLAVAGFVVVVGLFGLLATLLTSINERRREMAILRSVGARPQHLFGLMVGEATLVTLFGVTVGIALLQLLLIIGRPLIASRFGLYLQSGGLSANQLLLILLICGCGTLVGFIPGYRMYRYSLADGMTVKI
jgi:putative ABC transport system permease protein